MRWYYSSDGDASKRGLVEQEALFEMARKGELKPTDLVCQEDGEQGWLIASFVEGLFTGQPHASGTTPQPQSAARAQAATPARIAAGPAAQKPKRDRKLARVLTVLSILALLMTAAVITTVILETRRKNAIPPPSVITGPPLAVVRSNRVAVLAQQLDIFLRREDVARSQALLAEMKGKDDNGAPTATYSERIGVLKAELFHFSEMQRALRKGKLTTDMAGELIRVYEKRGGTNEVVAFAESVLADKKALSPEVSLSLARLFTVLKERDRLHASLKLFSDLAPTNGPAAAHLEVVKMYCTENQPTNAMLLLQKYLGGVPTNSAAWYELGAIRSATGHEDAALDAIKEAIKLGDDDTKRAAAADPRFAPVSDKWSFKRLTRVKD